MLFPSASFLLSALIAHCVADLQNDFNQLQVQVPAWPPLDPITGEQLSKTHVKLAECIREREKSANEKLNLLTTLSETQTKALVWLEAKVESDKNHQKEISDLRLAIPQQNTSSNVEYLLEKLQTCESRINSSAPAGAKKTSPKLRQKLIELSTGQYYISNANQKVNWYMASKMCKSYGMELASVETEEENDALLGEIAMMKDDFHISGTDLGSEGKFYWASTGEPFGSFKDWTGNNVSPSNSGGFEHCVHYWYFAAYGEKHTWNDVDCNRVNRFICELME